MSGRRRGGLAAALACAVLTGSCDPGPHEIQSEPEPASPEPALSASMASGPTVLVGAGDIARCDATGDEATANLLDTIPGTVFTLGDNAYQDGTLAEYNDCYGPGWGRHKARTRPAPGDKDYRTADAAGYFDYFGAAAGERGKGYYSYDLGDWHVVVLNSAIPTHAGSPQEQWLRADLAASTRECTVAYWHHPLYYSVGSTGVRPAVKPLWDALYGAGVELVLNSEQRNYERFAPQTPDGAPDAEYGIRQIIVGTAGSGSNSFGTVRPNSEVRESGTRGVLRLTLAPGGYAWKFIPTTKTGFTDSGTGTCHGPPPPVAVPGGPYSSESTVSFDGSASTDPGSHTPLSFLWNFGDGTTGTGAKPAHTYTANGTYTVTLTVTNSLGRNSAPATTTAVVANVPPTVQVGPDHAAVTGSPFRLAFTFSDPEPADGPWEYSIAWGDGSTSPGTANTPSSPVEATHVYASPGSFALRVTVTDRDGGRGEATATVRVESAAAGVVLTGAGDVGDCKSPYDDETARLLDSIPGIVFVLGDNAYPHGTATDYANCYAPTWGRHLGRTFAALGNHEYDRGNADPSFDYFGSRVGPRGKGYYSFDLGSWHIVVLNDNSSFVPFAAGSAQDQWLVADLAANTRPCVLAIWHQPRFYNGAANTERRILWDRLYAAGAEIVLNGHRHYYQRWAPQKPDGKADPVRGIRQFIVGTGGGELQTPTAIAANSEAVASVFGVLKLTLLPNGYLWEFVPVPGSSFTDSGSGQCH